MSSYYDPSSESSKELMPHAVWNLDIIKCRATGAPLEVLSVFDVGPRTCLCFAPRRSWSNEAIMEALNRLSQSTGYPITVELGDDRLLFPAVEEWARDHGVDLRMDLMLKSRVAERLLPDALAAINEHYNLDRGWPRELASKLMAILNREHPSEERWPKPLGRHSAARIGRVRKMGYPFNLANRGGAI
ncbi:universal stress protein [Ensifer sp. ENS08]|uniref:universal stress protein n=1 Tax=Ensifer sp. ENS08 TaxID=2769273 RepID=UPI001780FB0B|nr:universal stress protein [Ensifer sp. ENS08]MBD9571877.1 universal stress protein [Ensifer sp. ENS08]